jgi:hypothetical protein
MRAAFILVLCAGCYDLDALTRDYDAAVSAPDLATPSSAGDLAAPSDLRSADLATSDAATAPRWQLLPSPTPAALRGLALDDATLYAVGAASTIVRIDADDSVHLESPPPGVDLRAAASAGGSVWAVGDNGAILLRGGASSWSYSAPSDDTWYAAFALGDTDLFVAGSSGSLYRGSDFEDSSTFSSLYGLWGSAADAMVAVGAGGTIVARTGDPPWVARTSGVSVDLNAVTGRSGLILAVGAGGTVLRSSDGQSWTAEASGTTTDLFGVWLSGDEAFAVGDGGIVLHRLLGVWQTQHTGGAALRAVLGRATNDVWAVGDGGTLLHYAP